MDHIKTYIFSTINKNNIKELVLSAEEEIFISQIENLGDNVYLSLVSFPKDKLLKFRTIFSSEYFRELFFKSGIKSYDLNYLTDNDNLIQVTDNETEEQFYLNKIFLHIYISDSNKILIIPDPETFQ
ncbi:MAG: hypothetical protein NZZ41_02920 [Candidatus Dojkabacteria bacterium]|nr:hypothetical protein [Candidatus Dojkabacteria bacterium]